MGKNERSEGVFYPKNSVKRRESSSILVHWVSLEKKSRFWPKKLGQNRELKSGITHKVHKPSGNMHGTFLSAYLYINMGAIMHRSKLNVMLCI